MRPFTREFAALSPCEFVERTLVERLRAEAVMVGADFTFGHRAAGIVDTVRELGEQRGFTTHGVGCYRPRPASGAPRPTSVPVRGAEACGRGHGQDRARRRALPAPGRYRGAPRRLGAGPGVGDREASGDRARRALTAGTGRYRLRGLTRRIQCPLSTPCVVRAGAAGA
ncbi:hypothetical protein [Amycolatopsis thermoflava]|uniref:hypothetical protein n=1 Tax=Amycolatopsis thermoflava TaxID=84480 RepID=UPI001E3FCF1D|nr:hypothetical protein [Amycolatopsis thermoflava]